MISLEVDNFLSWRAHARQLIKRKICPENITWLPRGSSGNLFDEQSQGNVDESPIVNPQPKISRDFITLAESVACHRDNNRWGLLYCLLWRLIYENRGLLAIRTDDLVNRISGMHRAVSRDKHKMKAFVRFKKISVFDNKGDEPTQEHFVAWFEPEHLIVPSLSPFFVKRFANMSWSILTPDTCAHWDLDQLSLSEGVSRAPKIKDDLENLWLTYYKHIFNPARLKVKAMQAEMPKKYWKNLPEAATIDALIRGAHEQQRQMVDAKQSEGWHKTSKSKYIKTQQKILRKTH